jgi:succinoglycan biosynthesis transport protein ExoP
VTVTNLESSPYFPARGGRVLEDESVSVWSLVRVLRRRWRIIAICAVVLTAAPLAYGIQLERRYSAVATILVDPQEFRVIQTALSEPTIVSVPMEAQPDILRSQSLMHAAMAKLSLFEDQEFYPVEDGPDAYAQIARGLAAWSVGELLAGLNNLWSSAKASTVWAQLATAIGWTVEAEDTSAQGAERNQNGQLPAGDDATNLIGVLQAEETTALAEWRAPSRFEDRIYVSQPDSSRLLRVGFSSSDPAKAAVVANTLADLFVAAKLQRRIDSTRRSAAWISAQLPLAQQEVLAAERRVAEFRSEHQLSAGKTGTLAEAELLEVNRSLVETRTSQAEKRAKLRLVQGLRAQGANLDALEEVLTSSLISSFRRQEAELSARDAEVATAYGALHPKRQAVRQELAKVTARIDEEVQRIVRGLENDIAVLGAQERGLRAQLDAARGQQTVDNQATVRLQELERAAAAKRNRYETLLARYHEASGQEEILDPGARVISRAPVPSEPSTPAPEVFGAVGFTAALVFGSMLALLREQSDKRLRSARQMERALHLPCLGLVPSVTRRKRGQRLHDCLRSRPASSYAQALRALYTQLAAPKLQPKVILVTSALPDEGKSSLAAALAVCAAQIGGARSLLVDFDLWRPTQAREFGLGSSPGVAELILDSGPERIGANFHVSQSGGIDILTAGLNPSEAARGLTVQSVRKLVAELRSRYDCVVIDSPPLLGVNDGRLLAMEADATVFAVRWGHTNREAAGAAVKILRDVSAEVFGAVLTRVDMKRHILYAEGDDLQFHRQFQKYYAR